MAKAGRVVKIEPNAISMQDASLRQTSTRQRLLCSLSAIAFMASVALPITIDTATMFPGFKSALADEGRNRNGNGDGHGRGNGNGKGKGDEYGGGRKPPIGGGDDDDDDDYDDGGHDNGDHDDGHHDHGDHDNGDNDDGDRDDSDHDNDHGGFGDGGFGDGGFGAGIGDSHASQDAGAPGDSDKANGGVDGEIDEASYAEAIESLADVPADVPAGLAPPTTPTIQQVFALGEGSVLNTEQEMLAIQNGWNTQN